MRYWSPVFHFYQPPSQNLAITEHVSETCYLPVLELLLEHPHIHITCNISGSLFEQMEELEIWDFFDKLRQLVQNNQIEILSSPFYHPLMPLTPWDSLHRQLQQHAVTVKHFLGISPVQGIFPPELALDQTLLHRMKDAYEWCLIDESSYYPDFKLDQIPDSSLLKLDSTFLPVASRAITEIIRSYPTEIHTDKFIHFFNTLTPDDKTVFSLHDVELFGHHYEERIDFLRGMFTNHEIGIVQVSARLPQIQYEVVDEEQLVASTWQTNSEDLQKHNPYPLWLDQDNDLQEQYNKLVTLAHRALIATEKPSEDINLIYSSAEKHFDRGVSSCHFYWLSNDPWWHPDLVERGAQDLIKTIRTLPGDPEFKKKAEDAYASFIKKLWQYHWSGKTYQKFTLYNANREDFLNKLPKL